MEQLAQKQKKEFDCYFQSVKSHTSREVQINAKLEKTFSAKKHSQQHSARTLLQATPNKESPDYPSVRQVNPYSIDVNDAFNQHRMAIRSNSGNRQVTLLRHMTSSTSRPGTALSVVPQSTAGLEELVVGPLNPRLPVKR